MLFLDFLRLMFMTPITGIFRINIRMTGLAGDLAFSTVIEGETVALQLRRGPRRGGMAKSTLKTKETCMDLRLSMAAYTFTR